MKVYVVSYGESGEGYRISSLHTGKDEAYDAAHRFMGNAWGFKDNPVLEEEVPYCNGFVWSHACDRVYMFEQEVS